MYNIKSLKFINVLWLEVYVKYTPLNMLDITLVKPFKVWLQWDRNMFIVIVSIVALVVDSP